ncbi:MAG: type II toxin-antitoxin system RelE/ParE family toxin, partial [Spirochaetota bacterium]
MKRTIIFYRTESSKCPVEEFLDSLPGKVLHKTLAVFMTVENQDFISAKFFKKLKNTNLWEIRIQYESSIYRYLCFQVHAALIVL